MTCTLNRCSKGCGEWTITEETREIKTSPETQSKDPSGGKLQHVFKHSFHQPIFQYPARQRWSCVTYCPLPLKSSPASVWDIVQFSHGDELHMNVKGLGTALTAKAKTTGSFYLWNNTTKSEEKNQGFTYDLSFADRVTTQNLEIQKKVNFNY